MHIKHLKIVNFRNYKSSDFDFSEGVNIIFGPNGTGKTSILEAIYFLGISKSFRTSSDRDMLSFSEEHFHVFGEFYNSKKQKLLVNFNYQKDVGKKAFVNGEKLEKLTEIIGKIPIVILSPEYENISSSGPLLRRKFLDRVISLTDREYLKKLIDYRNILRERNELLKDYQRKAFFDYDVLMEAIDERLVDCAIYIYTARRNFLREFRGIVRKEMEELSGRVRIYDMRLDRESLEEDYKDVLKKKLLENFPRDVAIARTTSGPHLERLSIIFDGKDIRDIGSQGEQKIALVAIKLAEAEFIYNRLKERPILLFDDVFAYLDENHRQNLCCKLVSGCQIILTTTDKGVLAYFSKDVTVEAIELDVA